MDVFEEKRECKEQQKAQSSQRQVFCKREKRILSDIYKDVYDNVVGQNKPLPTDPQKKLFDFVSDYNSAS